jgi:putative addiction module component (TIGR02574 family)
MTGRAHRVLEDALSLSDDERLDLTEQLLSSLPVDTEWLAELERRARRALADPSGGEAWEVVEQRLDARCHLPTHGRRFAGCARSSRESIRR